MSRFEGSLPGRALRAAGAAPVRLFSRFTARRSAPEGKLLPSQLFLLAGFALLLIWPHAVWNNLFGVGFAVLSLLIYWRDCAVYGLSPADPSKLGAGLWVFLLFCVLSLFWSESIGSTLRVALFYISGGILLYTVYALFRSERMRERSAQLFLAVLFVTSVYGLIDYVLHDQAYGVPIGGEILDRLCANMEHAINYAEFTAMAFPIALVWCLRQKGRKKLWALLLLPSPAALLLTYARTGWIALLFALALLAIWYDKRLLIPMVALAAVGFFLLPDSIRARFLSMLQFNDTGSSGRFTLWKECFAMLREHWLLGIGLGPDNFFGTYKLYCTGALPFDPPHANMGYLEIWLSVGIVGFTGFLAFFFGIFPRLRRARQKAVGKSEAAPYMALTASLAGAALANIPEHIWFYPRILWLWCLVYALALAATDAERL